MSTVENSDLTHIGETITQSIRIRSSLRDLVRYAAFTLIILLAGPVTYAQLSADFSIDKSSGCSPLAVQFTDLSTGSPDSYQWDLGNGNKPIINSPATIYIDPGTYNVSLTITKGGQSSKKTKSITVFKNPVAGFSASISKGCLPLDVYFTDKSVPGSGAITSWFWDFGDGSNTNQQSPVHKYQKSGKYKLSLIVTDANTCNNTMSIPDYITIDPPSLTTLAFSGDTLEGCDLPFNVKFTNTSSGNGLTYQWSFGDGGTATAANPGHSYKVPGKFPVYLVGTNAAGCSDTLKKPAYINILNNPVADFTVSKSQACAFENISFSNISSAGATSWLWDFGDGGTSVQQSPVHQFKGAGTYDVKLTVQFGNNCTRSAVKNAVINVLPSGTNFTADVTSGCEIPLTVNFKDSTASSNSWTWDFGDGTASTLKDPSHTYSSYGKYTVSLVTTNSLNTCVDTAVKVNFVNLQKSKAGFKVDKRDGCIPLTVAFTDTSISNDPIVGWQWDFGDGGTSNVQHPSHTFTAEKAYDITLIITTASGCIDTLIRPDYIRAGNPPTSVGFTVSKQVACAAEHLQFTDLSQHVNGWFWDFGAATDSTQNPNIQFRDTGTFTVTLIANFNGCPDTVVKPDYITISPPVASFSLHQSCNNPYRVTFTDASIKPQTWAWDYGDGSPISHLRYDTIHTYSGRGSYNIKLNTTSGACKDSVMTTVNIIDPAASFSNVKKSGCAPLSVTFTENSIDASRYSWDFGDGFTSTLRSPVHVYSDTGDFDVKLVVDSLGCKDSITIKKYVHVGEINADFSIDTLYGCKPLTVVFKESSTPAAGISSYLWDFGDGTTFNGKSPLPHVYSVAADYDVSLIITTASCKDTTTYKKMVQFPPRSSPDFTISDTLTCKGSTVSFAVKQPASNLAYKWDFGDGNISLSATPDHAFVNDGNYPVTLTVTNQNGCDSSMTKSIAIKDPVAGFSATPRFASCPNLLAAFTDQSSVNAISWNWNFGDGTGSDLKNPSHLYTSSDSNDVKLIITTRLGCTDTLLLEDYVVIAGPRGDFFFDPFKGCPPLTVSFLSNAKNITKYQWDFGDGAPFGNGNDISHDYDKPGIFHPRLILTDTSGCTLAFQSPDSIEVKLLDIFAGQDKYICLHDSVILNGSGEGTAFSWTPTTGLSSSSSPTPVASPAVTTTYSLNTTKGKCISVDTITVFVNPSFPTANFSVPGVCLNDTSVFKDNSAITGNDKIKSWKWDFGAGDTSSSKDTMHLYNASGTYSVTLTVISDSGCTDSVTKQVQVYTLPQASFSAKNSCLTDVTLFTDLSTDTSGIKSREWTFGDGGTSVLSAPTHIYADTGAHPVTLIVTTNNNCKDTLTRTFFVNPVPEPDFYSGQKACFQTPFDFRDSSSIARGKIIKWDWRLVMGIAPA